MEEIADDYPKLTQTRIRNILAAFLFTEDDVFKRVSDLSGGERGRLSLAKLMLSEANFLILDEPTNHLRKKLNLWRKNCRSWRNSSRIRRWLLIQPN